MVEYSENSLWKQLKATSWLATISVYDFVWLHSKYGQCGSLKCSYFSPSQYWRWVQCCPHMRSSCAGWGSPSRLCLLQLKCSLRTTEVNFVSHLHSSYKCKLTINLLFFRLSCTFSETSRVHLQTTEGKESL